MFTRVFTGGLQRAAFSLLRPCFSGSFSSSPMRLTHLETTSLLSRMSPLSCNLHIQNLLQFVEKCEQELQTKSEVNSLNQLSLLAQDDRLVLALQRQVDLLSGLTKLPRTHLTPERLNIL